MINSHRRALLMGNGRVHFAHAVPPFHNFGHRLAVNEATEHLPHQFGALWVNNNFALGFWPASSKRRRCQWINVLTLVSVRVVTRRTIPVPYPSLLTAPHTLSGV